MLAVPMFRKCFKGFIDCRKTALKITNLYQQNEDFIQHLSPVSFGCNSRSKVILDDVISSRSNHWNLLRLMSKCVDLREYNRQKNLGTTGEINSGNPLKGAVSYFTHMLLRIINLKALGQRFQVRNPRWRPQRRAILV